ncbi:MAG TPA: alpha-2-macroglobulin family protein, partial [Pyrinomonadaceae bacterium]
QEAVVPGARVTATHASSGMVYEATTDDEGRFILRNLPVGLYTVRVDGPGFMSLVMDQVPVRSSNITRLDAMLNVGNISETVEISDSGGAMLNMTSATIGKSVRNNFQLDGVNNSRAQISTPRLREYFPETLVWQPQLETDARGRAKLDFKLADNITTWKMAVIGSTIDGEVGIVEKEIRAFQPFFVEHDPPRILTEGDEIQLPVVLRNYLDKSQAVELEIKPESWFALTGPARKRAEVASGDSSRETFGFRAISSTSDGKQRITATGSEASDAIEKPITVHPDGEERAVVTSKILAGESTMLQLNIPADSIKSSVKGELKIYPNLMSHVAESVEGILERPHGCGEQTISSTYPNLMILRFNKNAGIDSPVTIKAQSYLLEGYKRLLTYRAESGGFSYWGGTASADFALSAYALRFLNDARDYIEVDEAVLNGVRDYLIQKQGADGSWAVSSPYALEKETIRANTILTSYITRIIASLEAKSEAQRTAQTAPNQQKSPAQLALKRALDYLARHLDEAKDAYMLASYALAATDARDTAAARTAIAKLRALAHAEKDGTISWQSETSTPFHGWGTAGHIETTALALQALSAYCGAQASDCETEQNPAALNQQAEVAISQLMNRALLYLLRQKDRYGVWQSTQATINVLNALVAVSSKLGIGGASLGTGTGGQAEILVNGRPATTVTLPQGRLNNPILIDISNQLLPGDNQILIRRNAASQLASAQAVSTFYVPWSVARAEQTTNTTSDSLRLAVNFSKSQLSINEEVACKVEVGGRRYGGMLLAEIGLPPGADVDRASLELAVKNSGWSLSRYDVLPDRLIVYLWPRNEGNRFEFKFRPRFGLIAQSAPSVLYDYYNPEARVVIAPTKFTVR